MSCHSPRITMLLFVCSILPLQSTHADDLRVNRLLASQCAQCHGTDGYSVAGIEPLAGESAKDLIEDLRDMRKEDKPENIMDHQAMGYTEDQIRRIAAYYSTIPEPGGSRSNESEEKEEKEKEEEESEYEKHED